MNTTGVKNDASDKKRGEMLKNLHGGQSDRVGCESQCAREVTVEGSERRETSSDEVGLKRGDHGQLRMTSRCSSGGEEEV